MRRHAMLFLLGLAVGAAVRGRGEPPPSTINQGILWPEFGIVREDPTNRLEEREQERPATQEGEGNIMEKPIRTLGPQM